MIAAWVLRLLLICLLTAALTPWTGASAQTGLQAKLVEFPAWLGPDGSLRAVLELTNGSDDAATGLRVALAVHQGITSRSALERSFAGRLGPTQVSDTVLIDGVVEPGETRRVAVEKPLREFRFFQSAPPDRVYPVRLTVRSNLPAPAPIDTHMIYFNATAPVPLELALVLPIHSRPVYDTGLTISSEDLGGDIGGGRVSRMLDALEEFPDTPVTLAPSGLLLSTLADLEDGYTPSRGPKVARGDPAAARAARTSEQIAALLRRPSTSAVASAYSAAHLSWMVSSGLSDRAQEQVIETRRRLEAARGSPPMAGWLLPPSGVIDAPALDVMRRTGVSGIILSPDAVRAERSSLTTGAVTRIDTRGGSPVIGLVGDLGLATRLTGSSEREAVQARQRFLAETATIMLERPAERRVVAAIAPSDWSPTPVFLRGLLESLTSSPWLRGTTPGAAARDFEPRPRELAAPEIVESLLTTPPAGYAAGLLEAGRAIDDYARVDPPQERLARLEHKLLVAESSDWWHSRAQLRRGKAFATSIDVEVERELRKIRTPEGEQTITLTSQAGVIPLVLTTTTGYPVNVVIRLESDKLRFPDGTRREYRVTPPARTIEVRAIAETSGTFPLRVIMETPNGRRELAETRVLVRSTAYNRVAVSITVGAAAFLVLWWVVGASRRRLSAA